jgi:hypothetical protein
MSGVLLLLRTALATPADFRGVFAKILAWNTV